MPVVARNHFRGIAAGLAATALVVVTAVGSAGVAGAAKRSGKASLPSPASGLSGTVQIGAAFPLTGTSAVIGQSQEKGAELAAAQINHDGGVLGKKLVIDYGDSQAKVTQTVTATQQIVTSHHVPIVIGEYLSDDTIAMGKYLEQQKIIQINPGSSSTTIAKIGKYSFSVIGLTGLLGKLAAHYLHNHHVHSIAILATNTAYGRDVRTSIGPVFKHLGGKVAVSMLFKTGASTFRSEITRLKKSGATVYVVADYEPSDVDINKQAYEAGIPTKKWFGIYLSICVQGSTSKTIAGFNGLDLAYKGPKGGSYIKAYKKAFHQQPTTPYASYTYDAVMMAAKAMERAHTTSTTTKIRKAMDKAGHHYQGATGTITFDKHGQRISAPYALLTVNHKGKLKTKKVITARSK